MRFENYYDEIECRCCPECMGITPPHCAHCPQHVNKSAAIIEDGYDYSHLIGHPGIQRDNVGDETTIDQLLTDYDRILLRFGMRILCE